MPASPSDWLAGATAAIESSGGASSFSNVDQTDPYRPFVSNNGNKNPVSLAVTSAVGEVVIDTGLQLDLALLSETLEYNGIELEKKFSSESTVVGGVRSFDFVNVPSFDIGPLHLENKIASMSSDDRGTMSGRFLLGYVGVFFFGDQRVTLDLFNQKMYIEPNEDVQQQMREQFDAQQEDGNESADMEEEGDGGS